MVISNDTPTVGLTIEGAGRTLSGDDRFQTIVIEAGAVQITQLTLSESSDAGLEVRADGEVTVSDSAILGNDSGFGGILNEGELTLETSTVADNVNTDDGGGVANYGTMSITGTTIENNQARNGGGIFNAGTLTVEGSVIQSNDAEYSAGIDNLDTLTVVESHIFGNVATKDAGVYNDQGTAVIERSTINDNRAVDGAGAYNDDGTLFIINSTLGGNQASNRGGGIENLSGSLAVTNSTVSDNTAANGGGIHNMATLNLANSIVANSSGGDCVTAGGTVDSQHSLLEDGANACGVSDNTNGNIVGADPALASLALRTSSNPAPIYPLTASSPAIDKGDNALAVDETSTPLTTDQRGTGFTRIQNLLVDMGAYEAESTTVAVTLGWFLASAEDGRVTFRWQTATESATAGFNVLAVVEEARVQLNDELIPSPAINSVAPIDYQFMAATDATVFYLEEVRTGSTVEALGPFALGEEYGAYVATGTDDVQPAIWLPIIER